MKKCCCFETIQNLPEICTSSSSPQTNLRENNSYHEEGLSSDFDYDTEKENLLEENEIDKAFVEIEEPEQRQTPQALREPKKKKARKGHPNQSQWVITKNKRHREKGEAYKGLGKHNTGKWKYKIPRSERKLNPPCNCKLSQKKSRIQCREFSKDLRQIIFKNFWVLTWKEKKVYVRMSVDVKKPTDLKNRINSVTRRNVSLFFHLKKEEFRIRVCKRMFLNTLDLKQ